MLVAKWWLADMAWWEVSLSALVFLGLHVGISGSPVRQKMVERLAEKGYQIVFSVLSVLALIWLVAAWRNAPELNLWSVPGLSWLPVLLMPIATVLLICAYSAPNPTAIGGGRFLKEENPAKGIFRVTRHPLMVAIVIFSFSHILTSGDLADLILFGSLFMTAALGMPSIDKKLHDRNAESFDRLAAVTSIIPFVAIMQGRNTLSLSEIGILRLAGGLALYVVMLYGHEYLSGVSLTQFSG
jgi:uncharacterized membrane protein